MFVERGHKHRLGPPLTSSKEVRFTCRLSCLDEELLLLRDKEIFCDMTDVCSSEPISPHAMAGVPAAFLLSGENKKVDKRS